MRPWPQHGLVELLEGSGRTPGEAIKTLGHPIEPASMGELHDQHACDARLLCLSRSEETLVLCGKTPKRVFYLSHGK